jgi:hypothetical protein
MLLLALSLAACGGGGSSLEGTWAIEAGRDGTAGDGSDRLVVRGDNSLSLSNSTGLTCAGTATPLEQSATFRLDFDCGAQVVSLDATVDGDTLHLRLPGAPAEEATYTRVEE